jgi:hypothetical protein
VNLVDPTGGRRSEGRAAPRLQPGADMRVGLVDAMLHKRGLLGQGLLDAVELAMGARVRSAAFGRVRLDPITPEDPDVWATVMASRYHALVIAAGD